MIIIHKIDDLLFHLFPRLKGDNYDERILKVELERFYSTGPYKPTINIKDEYVEIIFKDDLAQLHGERYQNVVKLCEEGKLKKAKQKIRQLIREAPNVSEYYRILGQIQSDQGQQEKGIDTLIDALRWDPNNEWALIMMGNIYARHKDDITTAMKYYEKAIENNPKDGIALNNVGANLMQLGKTAEAIPYFEKAIELNPNYPNTHYALAMVDEMAGNYKSAFKNTLNAIKNNQRNDDLFKSSMALAIETAQSLINENDGLAIVQAYATKLEFEFDRAITIEEDSTQPTAAKTEMAENHNRDNDIVKYKPEYPAVHHLMMHQLVNLAFACQARLNGNNKIFTTSNENKTDFIKSLEQDAVKLNKKGFSAEMLSNYFGSLFDGINRQVYNTPIDLFIEDFIFDEYPDFHPFQFLSLLALIEEGIKAVTDKEIIKMVPLKIISKSKIYNLINALHFKSLFGVDLIYRFKANRSEKEIAETLFNEYSKVRGDKKPGIEYEIVQKWADKLELENYFNLLDETEFRKAQSNKDMLDKAKEDIPQDPTEIEHRQEAMDTFAARHKDEDVNMAVVMFMVGAIQYYRNIEESDIKQIAFEIANIGVNGISPDKKNYKVPSINGKTFSGYHLLAYYYVSWALILPDMLASLKLPFNKEYEMAKIFDNK